LAECWSWLVSVVPELADRQPVAKITLLHTDELTTVGVQLNSQLSRVVSVRDQYAPLSLPATVLLSSAGADLGEYTLVTQKVASNVVEQARTPNGAVVVHSLNGFYGCRHERAMHAEFAKRLAPLTHSDFAGDYDPSGRYPGLLHFVPGDHELSHSHRTGALLDLPCDRGRRPCPLRRALAAGLHFASGHLGGGDGARRARGRHCFSDAYTLGAVPEGRRPRLRAGSLARPAEADEGRPAHRLHIPAADTGNSQP